MTTRIPRWPICRSTPPVAFFARSRFGLADSSAASPVSAEVITTPCIEVTGRIRSVLPIPDPPTSITHTGSPGRYMFAA